jgi:hypothetical protein
MTNEVFEHALTVIWRNGNEYNWHWSHVKSQIIGAIILSNNTKEQRETLDFLYRIASEHDFNQ